jgi:hypothetical protein
VASLKVYKIPVLHTLTVLPYLPPESQSRSNIEKNKAGLEKVNTFESKKQPKTCYLDDACRSTVMIAYLTLSLIRPRILARNH